MILAGINWWFYCHKLYFAIHFIVFLKNQILVTLIISRLFYYHKFYFSINFIAFREEEKNICDIKILEVTI